MPRPHTGQLTCPGGADCARYPVMWARYTFASKFCWLSRIERDGQDSRKVPCIPRALISSIRPFKKLEKIIFDEILKGAFSGGLSGRRLQSFARSARSLQSPKILSGGSGDASRAFSGGCLQRCVGSVPPMLFWGVFKSASGGCLLRCVRKAPPDICREGASRDLPGRRLL